ncbi:MAG: glycosyltransferase family 2 protein [Dehalococcoidia bacterium]|nr:glycosyltransferase family 2 protein [Dehalococcoidia bacterium]MDW8120267.1 glycosyltransferase family 2 protein [Chloroflexota bacterium]
MWRALIPAMVGSEGSSLSEDTEKSTSPLLPRRPTTTVIVPAYNEEQGIGVVLEKIFRAIDEGYEVIVVDDGSTDNTAAVASRFPCRVIRHPVNRGKGEALKTGIAHAQGENIIWIDADDTYPAERIPDIAEALRNGADLVYASRQGGREHIPLFNRVGLALFRFLIRNLYGFTPQDPCTGLCGVKAVHIQRMALEARRFAIEPEIAMKAGRMRLRMMDLPIVYRPRIGRTKLSGIKAGLEDMGAILRFLFWRPPARRSLQVSSSQRLHKL